MCLSVPARLLSIAEPAADPVLRAGRVSLGGIEKEISLAYVPEARAGDYVLVHAGFAIAVIDDAEAGFVFEYLDRGDPSAEEPA